MTVTLDIWFPYLVNLGFLLNVISAFLVVLTIAILIDIRELTRF